MLSKASSIISSRRQSVSPRRSSPTREGNASPSRSPLRSPILEEELASSASISSPNAQRVSKAASTFADFFSGSSEVVNGFSTTPNRQESYYTARARPGHSRANSTMSGVASFFGRSPPTKHHRNVEEEEEDAMLNLDIDRELFPQGVPNEIGLPDFDDLRGNAERLFMHMQISYQAKVEALREQRAAHQSQQYELDEQETRAAHLKSQLRSISQEQEERIQRLEAELEMEKSLRKAEQETRARSVRLVSKDEKPSLQQPGFDGHRLFSGEREDGLYSLSQAGFDSGDESADESSGGSRCWSPPDTPSLMSRSESPVRPGWPGLAAANMMEENLRLKARISELEETVDNCLGLVSC